MIIHVINVGQSIFLWNLHITEQEIHLSFDFESLNLNRFFPLSTGHTDAKIATIQNPDSTITSTLLKPCHREIISVNKHFRVRVREN